MTSLSDTVIKRHVASLYNQHEQELMSHISHETLVRGASVARDPRGHIDGITPSEWAAVQEEENMGLWKQTKELKTTILITACAAVTQ